MEKYRHRPAKSSMEHYQHFSGWEHQELESTNCMLKQLRTNLHAYEHQFHRKYSEHSEGFRRKIIPNCKENQERLPKIHSTIVPEQVEKKGSFLSLKNRNILKEGIENITNPAKQEIIHSNNSMLDFKSKLKPIRQHHAAKENEAQPQFSTISKSQNLVVRRPKNSKILQRIRNNFNQRQNSNKGKQEQFSDQKLMKEGNNLRIFEHKLREEYRKVKENYLL